jgi:hypothetical protein
MGRYTNNRPLVMSLSPEVSVAKCCADRRKGLQRLHRYAMACLAPAASIHDQRTHALSYVRRAIREGDYLDARIALETMKRWRLRDAKEGMDFPQSTVALSMRRLP